MVRGNETEHPMILKEIVALFSSFYKKEMDLSCIRFIKGNPLSLAAG